MTGIFFNDNGRISYCVLNCIYILSTDCFGGTNWMLLNCWTVSLNLKMNVSWIYQLFRIGARLKKTLDYVRRPTARRLLCCCLGLKTCCVQLTNYLFVLLYISIWKKKQVVVVPLCWACGELSHPIFHLQTTGLDCSRPATMCAGWAVAGNTWMDKFSPPLQVQFRFRWKHWLKR